MIRPALVFGALAAIVGVGMVDAGTVEPVHHQVVAGESWQAIAARYGVTADALQVANDLGASTSNSAQPRVGWILHVPVSPPAPTTTTAPATTTTTTPLPSTSTTTTAPPVTGRATPGTVGFLGDPASLRVIDSAANAPAGTSWNSQYGYLEVTAANLTLDGVYVKGGIDFYGAGTLTIRGSVVEFGNYWLTLVGRTGGSTIDVQNSTLRGNPAAATGNGAIQIQADLTVIAVGNDISGTADGIQIAGPGNRIERNWVHDLAMVGTYPNNTHNDGLQMYGGDAVIRGNYFDTGARSPYSNSCLFFQGSAIGAVTVDNNYLSGGGYSLYAENGRHTVTGNTFGPDHLWGTHLIDSGATVAAWSGNADAGGTPVNR